MRNAHYIQANRPDVNWSFSLHSAWWFESLRDALGTGMAKFTYIKKDGTTRHAFGTRNTYFMLEEHYPKSNRTNEEALPDDTKTIPYYDLDIDEWRSFNVLNFVSLDRVWDFDGNLVA